ncbi:chloramphenicol phosphotransferase [Methylobacterium nonmethylotrophicum]|uniref:chloramphenicol phosphotransferase n=1 Tax=Methylobacterium nonmethylotrophicum TaxID=1141884 RepID=UPI00197BF689|nr:chloramphenicol phosphotransferase [Methylobacterium nonmethylotrophicum]
MEAVPALRNVVVYLVGFAGVGKLTTALALAKLFDARVVDNHWINNPIFGLLDTDGVTPLPAGVWDQVAKVRSAVLETIATLSAPGASFIFTHEGYDGDPEDHAIYRAMASTAERRGAQFVPVRLLCEVREHARRIVLAERAVRLKCVDPDVAIAAHRSASPLRSGHPNELTLDISASAPHESAARILSHIEAIAGGTQS